MAVYLSFILASILLALTPGPDVLLVITIAAKEGFLKSFKLILGLATGVIFHTTLILLGISALITASPIAMKIIGVFGASYLLYLAWLTWIHRSDQVQTGPALKTKESYYLRGLIMNISNPKVLLFFLALFPQFALLDQPGYQWRIAVLGLLFIFVTITVFGGLAYLTAQSTQSFMKNPDFKLKMDFVTVGVFVLLAGSLIYSIF